MASQHELPSELDVLVAEVFNFIDEDNVSEENVEELADKLSPHMYGLARQISERMASYEHNQPSHVIDRVVTQFKEHDPFAAKPVTTLDQIISRYGINLERLRSVDITPYDEVCLLKAAAIAGLSRQTTSGLALAKKAMAILWHEATNIHPKEQSKSPSFRVVLIRAVYAMDAITQIYAYDGLEAPTSIDEVLINWDTIGSTNDAAESIDEEELFNAPGSEDQESKVGFRRLLKAEARERMQGLQLIGDGLHSLPDRTMTVRYFEPVIFEERDGILRPTPKDPEVEATGNKDTESSPYLSGDYVVSEITEELANGSTVVHVVAESPNYGNACYVLRGDTLAMLSQVLNKPINWQEVFSYPKVTARQLGATAFRHGAATDVPHKVVSHFNQDLRSTLKPIARAWFASAKCIYNSDLQVTEFNRLPVLLVQHLEPRIENVYMQMMEWINWNFDSSTSEDGGEEQLIEENERLRTENQHLKEINQALVETLAKIKALIDPDMEL